MTHDEIAQLDAAQLRLEVARVNCAIAVPLMTE